MDRLTEPRPWRFPAARTLRLANGMTVQLVDLPGRLVASVAACVALPTEVEEEGAEGVVAAYTSMMLLDAPHARSAPVSEVARIGAVITTGCDHRGPKVMADCPVAQLPRLLAALAPMLLTFEPTERSFQACRARLAAERALEERDPAALANKLFSESVLAPGRYARPVGGDERSLRAMTRQDVGALFERRVGPELMTLVIAGDLSLVDAEAAVREHFGRHPARGCGRVADRPPQPGGDGPRLLVRPGRGGAQTRIMLGCYGIDRLDPRWPSARLAAELLGGDADALVNRELRGRLGISYGFQVRFVPYVTGGLFLAAGSVAGAHAGQAVEVIRRTLARVVDEGVEDRLFERVRARMVTGAAEIYETALAVAQQRLELASCGIDEGFIDRHLGRLAALTRPRLEEDLRGLLQPDRLHVAVVGRYDDAPVPAERG